MSNVLEYTLSLQDKITAKLRAIGINNDAILEKFGKLQTQATNVTKAFGFMGTSIGTLKQKLDLLKAEKEWIPTSNLESIRKYNTEIKKLTKEIEHFETVNGSKFKNNVKAAISDLPFSNLLTNPVAQAGVALFASTKMAMGFDEGMAKINTTAQLTQPNLDKLKTQLLNMGREAGADLNTIPIAYEKIISQTNDAALSNDILKVALKGSKAGFTDLDTVGAALAQTLSIVGKENTNAQEVSDTFFAAKRVGAGEFKDFAAYMPTLINAGKAIGVNFKDAAGTFAYMTGKGQDAANSAMLIQNVYSALGKGKIQEGLKLNQADIFDKNGAMKSIDEVMLLIGNKMAGLSDQGKSAFLESIDLKDQQAKQGFMALISDNEKLKESLVATNKAAGETDTAFSNAQNPMMAMAKLMSDVQYIGIQLGGAVSTVLMPVFSVLATVVTGVASAVGWLSTKFKEGNPVILGIASVLMALTFAWGINLIAINAGTLADTLAAGAKFLLGGATKFLSGAMKGLNAIIAMNPIIWLVLGVIALIGVIVFLVYKVDGWGKMWNHTVKGAKLLWESFTEGVKHKFNSSIDSIMIALNVVKKGWYDFKNAVGIGDTADNQAMIAEISADTERRKKEIVDGAEKVKQLQNGAAAEFKAGFKSLSINDKSFADIKNEIKGKLGLNDKAATDNGRQQDETVIKTNGGGAAFPTDDADKDKKGKAKETANAIATGGTKNTVVHINFKDMIGNLNISSATGSFAEAANTMVAEIEDRLARLLAMAAMSAG